MRQCVCVCVRVCVRVYVLCACVCECVCVNSQKLLDSDFLYQRYQKVTVDNYCQASMKVQVAAVQAVLETLVASDENGLESFGGGPKKRN